MARARPLAARVRPPLSGGAAALVLLLLAAASCARPAAAAVSYNPQLWNGYNRYEASGIHANMLFHDAKRDGPQLFPLDFGWNVEVRRRPRRPPRGRMHGRARGGRARVHTACVRRACGAHAAARRGGHAPACGARAPGRAMRPPRV
jgi:hypothetical protein